LIVAVVGVRRKYLSNSSGRLSFIFPHCVAATLLLRCSLPTETCSEEDQLVASKAVHNDSNKQRAFMILASEKR